MKAIVWERTPKEVLDAFDTRTKICHMNCGPSAGDPRSAKERKFQCPDCWNACAVCGAGMQEGETDCPVCTGVVSTPDQDFVRDIPDIQPLGWISEHTRQWLKDPNSHGPGMFTVNRNGQGGMWALYAGSDFQRLYQHAEKLREQCENLLRIEQAARRLYEETEEFDFPDGMGKGALQEYWDELDTALEQVFKKQAEATTPSLPTPSPTSKKREARNE